MSLSSDDALTRRAMRRLGESIRGRYSISRLIGIGGMAAVYGGIHRSGFPVAVKILHERLASDPEIERLFRREALLANTVGHDGVVPVTDDDVTEDGCVFLVMPLLVGETLRARAERMGGRLPMEEVVVLAHSLLETLAAAHEKRIVHRDIKPENLFLTTAGELKVLDFGIGRFFQTNEAASVTFSGRALGTPAYMAPEQALGRLREVDARTDLWAVGATMFSLLSGHFVHEAESGTEMAVLAATRPARSLGEVAPDVPAPLRALVDRALAFDKAARWESAGAMARALQEVGPQVLGGPIAGFSRPAPRIQDPADGFDSLPTRPPPFAEAPPADEVDDPLRHGPRHRAVPPPEGGVPAAERTTTSTTSELRPRTTGAETTRIRSASLRHGAIAGSLLTMLGALLAGAVVLRRVSGPVSEESSPRQVLQGSADASPDSDLLGTLAEGAASGELAASYLAGIQLWRDASMWNAAVQFGRTAKANPSFAAANLWTTFGVTYVDSEMRGYFAQAGIYRAALTRRQQDVLAALEPAMGDPSDLPQATSRLVALLREHPHDDDLRLLTASRLDRLMDTDRTLETLSPLLERPNPPPLARLIQARAIETDDPTRAIEALRACVTDSVSALDCLWDLNRLESYAGHCDALEPICRQMIARQPTSSSESYACLAEALRATGQSDGAVRSAYEERYRLLAGIHVLPSIKAQDTTRLAIADGRLESAEIAAAQWQETAADDAVSTTTAYVTRIVLDLELGRTAAAKNLAQNYTDRARAWSQSDYVDTDAETLYIHALVGDLSPSAGSNLRARVLAAVERPDYGTAARRWYNAHIQTSWTVADALNATSNIPEHAFFGPASTAEDNYNLGRVFALAGLKDKAEMFYRQAMHSCSLGDALFQTISTSALAHLVEDSAPREACDLYQEVLRRWGRTPLSRSVITARQQLRTLHCAAN